MSRMAHEKMAEAELARVFRAKVRTPRSGTELGGELVAFFKTVQKRQGKFTKIAECWEKLVPQLLDEHCCLESLNRGTLTVLVDSSPHLYELKQLLLSGLEKQLTIAAKTAGLRKINLKLGRWYEGDDAKAGKLNFGSAETRSGEGE